VPGGALPGDDDLRAVSFRTLNRDTGNRLRRQIVDEQTGDVVESDNQAKGYEVGKGEYIVLDDDELKAVQIESNHTIDIERFVPRAEIDGLYLDTPYYLAPTDRVGEEAFAVIREAMRAEKMVGLARVVLFRRERIMMLEPRDKWLGSTTCLANEGMRPLLDEIPISSFLEMSISPAHHRRWPASSSLSVRGPLRERPDRADPLQAEGHADHAAADASPDQRHQPDGRAAPQRRG
jgi:hypothetical protein